MFPRSERDAWMWQTVFTNMAKWLPDDEAKQLRFEFAQELERLKHAAQEHGLPARAQRDHPRAPPQARHHCRLSDGRLAIRYRGLDLPYITFDKLRQVSQAAIVENKHLGAVLLQIRERQLERAEPRSQSAPRRARRHAVLTLAEQCRLRAGQNQDTP
jgi:hypothetical protein